MNSNIIIGLLCGGGKKPPIGRQVIKGCHAGRTMRIVAATKHRLVDWCRVEHRLFLKPRAVISFPKSGRTWLRVLLDDLGIEARYRHAGVENGAPLLEETDWREARRYRRVLVMVRDPRDTAVSYFHHCTTRLNRPARMGRTIPPILGDFLRDARFGVEKIARHNLAWTAIAAEASHIGILTYERLYAETAKAVADVARFFDNPVQPERIAMVVEDNRFEKMRQREAKGVYGKRYGESLLPGNPNDPNSFKVRKGRVGGHREEMSPDDITYCDDVLQWLGYADLLASHLEIAALTRRTPKPIIPAPAPEGSGLTNSPPA